MRNKVLVIGIIAILVILFAGIRYGINQVNTFTFNKAVAIEDEISLNESYDKITVSATNAKVEFIPTKSNETKVSFGGLKKSRVKFEAKVKGDTLSVLLKEKGPNFFSFSKKGGLQLMVHIPEKMYKDIKAETKNGMIQAENLQANAISFETKNGYIKLMNSEGDTVDLRTNNGQISISDVSADVNAQTDNGRIAYKANDINNQIALTTANGLISVKLSEKPSNAVINAKTSNGYVNIFGSKGKTATYGEGNYLMKLRTKNGRINVNQ